MPHVLLFVAKVTGAFLSGPPPRKHPRAYSPGSRPTGGRTESQRPTGRARRGEEMQQSVFECPSPLSVGAVGRRVHTNPHQSPLLADLKNLPTMEIQARTNYSR